MSQIINRLKEKDTLPPLPEVVVRVYQQLKDPDSSAKDLAGIVMSDPVLAGRVLKMSNSAGLSTSSTVVHNLRTAITRLGRNEIKKVVYTYAMLNLFKDVRGIDLNKFWKHSFSVAYLSQMLSKILGDNKDIQGQAYLAGLMHDIGVIVFGYLFPTSYTKFLNRIAGDITPRDYLELSRREKDSYGIDHSQLGANYIDEWWPVDDAIITGIGSHHTPNVNSSRLSKLSKFVIVANKMSNSKNMTNGINVYSEPLTISVFKPLNIKLDQIKTFLSQSSKYLETIQ